VLKKKDSQSKTCFQQVVYQHYAHINDSFSPLHFAQPVVRMRNPDPAEPADPPTADLVEPQRVNRSSLRPIPACPWWHYVWSQQTKTRVGDDGKVPVGTDCRSLDAPPRATVIRCLRLDGDLFYLQKPPNSKAKPVVLLHVPRFQLLSPVLLARIIPALFVTRQKASYPLPSGVSLRPDSGSNGLIN
jgi:hypothetical protein